MLKAVLSDETVVVKLQLVVVKEYFLKHFFII